MTAMRLTKSLLPALALLAALVALPGCPALTTLCKWTHLCTPPVLELPEAVPQDFELVMKVTDQLDPPADYLVTYRRSGQCDYRVTVRAPRRRQSEATFSILENQVLALYDAVRAAKYDELDDRYPSSEGEVGKDKALGVQAYSVRANDLAKEVQAHFQAVPALEQIRSIALTLLPERALTDTGPGAATPKVQQVIGDMKTKIFYVPDDPRLKDVPADRRQPFNSTFDALNFGYAPAPGLKLTGGH